MKPLLRPARQPHPDILTNMLGLTGLAFAENMDIFETSVARILSELQHLTSTDHPGLEQKLDSPGASLRAYSLNRKEEETTSGGLISLAYDKRMYTLTGRLSWSHLPNLTDIIINTADRLWNNEEWSVLYLYDQDDYSLQNTRSLPGMEYSGLDRDQVDLISRYGTVDEIDPEANPGFMLNHDGLLWSVQWLNYWSADAQERLFETSPAKFPVGVQIRDLGKGAICVRLGERPGRFDDVGFHMLQLECRRCLPFRPSFRLYGGN